MAKFELVAIGGTFDILHAGHKTLLAKAFEISNEVIIGLVSDEFATRKGKLLVNDYKNRYDVLTKLLKKFKDRSFQIHKLENDFGPAALQEKVQALVVSEETQRQGAVLNKLRAERNFQPVEIFVIPMVLARDGTRISTTRIKNYEIDEDGNLLSVDK